jgi:hypothetical protein
VPSTEKCSLDNSVRTCGRFSNVVMNLREISRSSSRSRFLQNTVASHSGLSADSPTLAGSTVVLRARKVW